LASFVRIHRSYIVNLERVVRIEPYGKDSRLAILTDGARLPVSRAGYARLKALLDERKYPTAVRAPLARHGANNFRPEAAKHQRDISLAKN